MDTAQTSINKGRKFDQVVAGARDIFLRDGFEGASVDDIAQQANVSKATLYKYFPDKRLLFLEVCAMQCRALADSALDLEQFDRPITEILRNGAAILVRFLTSKFGQNIHQLAIGEAERFPEFAREFYRTGPSLGQERVRQILQIGVARGELEIDDQNLAAEQFIGLCRTDLWLRVSFKMQDDAAEAEIIRVADGAVETFMARYGKT